jgi:hypothetical protein
MTGKTGVAGTRLEIFQNPEYPKGARTSRWVDTKSPKLKYKSVHVWAPCGWAKGDGGRNGSTIKNNSARFRGFNWGMKPLILFLLILLSAMLSNSNAQTIVHGRRGTAVQTANGTAVHTNHNWSDTYWHTNKYGYWNGQRGYWHVVNGKHVFVVVN